MNPSAKSLAEFDQLQASLRDWYAVPEFRWEVFRRCQEICLPWVGKDIATDHPEYPNLMMAQCAMLGMSLLYHEYDGKDADP